jgi:hypothetical protein
MMDSYKIIDADAHMCERLVQFFTANIRNGNTREPMPGPLTRSSPDAAPRQPWHVEPMIVAPHVEKLLKDG